MLPAHSHYSNKKKPFTFKIFKYGFLTLTFLLTHVSSALVAIGVIPWATSDAVGTPNKPTLVKHALAGPEVEMADNATGQVRLFYQVHDTDSLVRPTIFRILLLNSL